MSTFRTPQTNRPGGFLVDLSHQVRLILALIADKRVPAALKLIPVASLIYLVVPTDFIPIIPLDDAAVLWFGMTLFVQLSPAPVVAEHRLRLEMGPGHAAAGQESEVVFDVQPTEEKQQD